MNSVGEKVKVKGTAIVAGISRNGIKYTDEELMKGSKSLKGVTIIKDHNATTDNSVGKVENQKYDTKTQSFEGWVEEDGTNLLSKIKDKRIRVSVGASVEKLIKEKEDEDVLTAKGIRYMELSLTPTPGIPDASIEADENAECAVTESFDKKQLKTKLSETEINSIVESLEYDDDEETVENEEEKEKVNINELEDSKMGEEEKPVEEPVIETPVEEPVAEAPKEEPVAEVPAEEPVAEPTEEKKDEATEMVKGLVKENLALKAQIEKSVKVQEEKKMEEKEVIETKTKKDVAEVAEQFDNYVIEQDKGKVSFFKMPNTDGSY